MILLYQFEKEKKGAVARQFLEHANHAYRDIDHQEAFKTLRQLFENEAGQEESVAEVDAPQGSAICFSADVDKDEAGRIIGTLQQIGLEFTYHVLADDTNLDLPLGEVLEEHARYQAFIKQMTYLQQLIDACASLRQENYDPDRWSELKLAVADANDFLDAVFSDSESILSRFEPEDIDRHINGLQAATKKLLS